METIPKDPFLEFNPNTLQEVRKVFNLHQPGAMEEIIRNFQEWIDKQNHFIKKDFPKHYLEMSVILAKGSLERAKKNLDRLCTLKTLIPKFFSHHDVKNELMDLSNTLMTVCMPKLTPENERIVILRIASTDIEPATFLDYYRITILMSEYMKAHDYQQGCLAIVDIRNTNVMNFTMKINIVDMRSQMTVLMEGYGTRIKGIHFISESKAIDTLVSVFKQVLSEKVGSRIKVHKTVDGVYQYIPKDLLPEDYGGKEKRVKDIYFDMVNVSSMKENVEYLKDICQAGTDEAYRQTATYNEEILGMPGSFRTLQVD